LTKHLIRRSSVIPRLVASLASVLKRFALKFGGRPRLPEVARQSLEGTPIATIGNWIALG
jgi:hypothetical protein